MSVFRDIEWDDCKKGTGSFAKFLMFEYNIWKDKDVDKWVVTYYNILTGEPSKDATGFEDMLAAKEWSFEHLNIKMKPYLKL